MAFQLVGPAAVIFEIVGRGVDLGAGLADRLAVVQGLHAGQLVAPGADFLRHPEQQAPARGSIHARPWAGVERPPGRRDGGIDVRRIRFGHVRDMRAGRRVVGREDLAGRRVGPLPVDQEPIPFRHFRILP